MAAVKELQNTLQYIEKQSFIYLDNSFKSADTIKVSTFHHTALYVYFLYFLNHINVTELDSYIEDESRHRSESVYVDHGQSVWKVTLTRTHEEQPGHSIQGLTPKKALARVLVSYTAAQKN